LKGWAKIKTAAKYSGVSSRTFRKWLRAGLKYSRLSSGTLLIKIEWIDEYLEGFEVVENEVSKLTEEICSEL
jgi:predicted site-specific integrase-resolvase